MQTLVFTRRDRYAVWLLSLIVLCLFADQNLMAPNLTQIAQEFGFSPEERDIKLGGEVSLVFWLLGGVVTLGIGYATDRINRKNLFSAVVLMGAIPCLLTGFVTSYTQLFWLRALTGIGTGGAIPLVYSLLGDYFPAQERAKAAGYIMLALNLGVAVGQLLAGMVGPSHGWRLPFILVAIPAILLVVLFYFTVQEPVRGQQEAQTGVHEGRLDWRLYPQLFRIASNRWVFIQAALATVPWGVFFTFLNDFYAQDKGFSVEKATLIVLGAGGASILGGFLGGLWGNRLYNRHPRYLPLFCAMTTVLGVLPAQALIFYPSQVGVADPNLLPPLILGGLAGFCLAMTAANVRAVLLNVNTPHTRGAIFALYNLADDLGRGFGPALISLLIVLMGGRTPAFALAIACWLVAAWALFRLSKTFPTDETHPKT